MSLSKQTAASYTDESNCINYISVCGICLSTYEIPKGLPCLHSFCLECIREWVCTSQGKDHKASVTCPNCRKECVLPDTGVDGLPTNFFITERNSKETVPTCSSCDNHDREIVARCHKCGFVCKECMQSHDSMRALKEHNVIKLDKLRVGKTAEHVRKLAISKRRQGNGVFKHEKTINLKNTHSEYNAWSCTILSTLTQYRVIAPTGKYNSKVHVFGIDGKNKLTIDTKVGLHPGSTSKPWAVCVNSDGTMYITDRNPWVKVHDAQGRFMHLLQLVDGNGVPSNTGNARGITIDDKQQIIVGDINNKTISIYGQDESFLNSFKIKDAMPRYLASSSHNTLVVCDNDEYSPLVEVDYSGNVIRTIYEPGDDMEWWPRGICCSKDGEIFVVNAASENEGAILRFTDSWQYTGCVVPDLFRPSGVSISEDGKILAVIDSHSELKIFRCS